MIQVNSLHFNHPSNIRHTRSHTLTPHNAVSIFCIIDGPDESILSILEDNILESISSTEWNLRETTQDFSYITEHYNTLTSSLKKEDLTDVRVLLGMLQGENLTLSTIGGASGLFIEPNGNTIDITVHENKMYEFHSISNGKIPPGATVYLSSDSLERILGIDVLRELADLPGSTWSETSHKIIERETANNLHIIRLSRKRNEANTPNSGREKRGQGDILRNKSIAFVRYMGSKRVWESTKKLIQKFPTLENRKYLYPFLGVGIVILFTLAYSLVSSILVVLDSNTSDDKNLLIQAKTLIDDGGKLIGNPSAFNTKISAAEKILFDLRKNQVHALATKELLDRIASMKKEVYDIQEIDMSRLVSIIPFNPSEIQPVGVFEKDKKVTLIGEKGAILNYVTGEKTIKVIPYPGNEVVKSFDLGEDGSAYLLTTENHVMSPRRDDFNRISVTGQATWEEAVSIKTFNGNIYIVESTKDQIQKHKPGINGFSQKAGILPKAQAGILDISIDGGIYLYMEDGKILRYLSDKDTPTPITLNKIPGEWGINTTLPMSFITRSYLSYTYIMNGNRIWIFQPNSKRFQDISSWEYKGQFELKTDESIKSAYVPRDGSIYVTTDKGVYELKFEFVDGKIIFK